MAGAAPSNSKLNSWKAIAAYLDREVRTVQRWEKGEALPVHRLGHLKRGSVYAFPEELDRWLAARSPVPAADAALDDAPPVASPPPPAAPSARHRHLRAWMAVPIAAAAVAATFWLARPRLPVPPPQAPDLQRLFAAATSEGGHLRMLAAGPDPGAMALARQGRDLYVASESARSIAILDTASLRPLATLHLALAPSALTATPGGARVVASSYNSDGLEIIDARSRHDAWVALDASVMDMALAPDGHTLYLAQGFDGLSRLDLNTYSLTHLATSACPSALALSPDGRTLYVGYQCGGPAGNRGHDAIGVFDTATQRFTATLAGNIPMVATALAVTPDGNELWSSSGDVCSANYDHLGCLPGVSTLVYVFSTATRKLLARIPVASGPVTHIQFLAAGTVALLDGRLADTTRREVLEALPDDAVGAAAVDDGRRVYLSLHTSHAVAVFDARAAAADGANPGPAPSSADCTPPTTGLAAWWPGDGTAADAAGLAAGQPSPGLRYAPARIGQGFLFDGRSSVNFGHGAALARPLDLGLTFAAWLKPLAPGPGAILSKQSPDGSRGWRLGLDRQLRLQLCLAGRCRTAPTPLRLGSWHFLALRADAATAAVFLDSQLAVSSPIAATANAATADLIAGQGFAGILDELTYYSSALGPVALQSLRALPACQR